MCLHCLVGTGVPCPPLCVSSEMWSLFPFSVYAVFWVGLWFFVGGGLGWGWGGGGVVCLCMRGVPGSLPE